MKFFEGMEVCISVKALYQMDEDLMFGKIVPDFSEKEKNADCFDLYNEDGELACFDGENVIVDQVGMCLVTFRNTNGDGTVYFALTHREAEVAVL